MSKIIKYILRIKEIAWENLLFDQIEDIRIDEIKFANNMLTEKALSIAVNEIITIVIGRIVMQLYINIQNLL